MNPRRILQCWTGLFLVAAVFALAGKPAPPTPIVATTTDRDFLEIVVGKTSYQTAFHLTVSVSGTGTHYRYLVGPIGTSPSGLAVLDPIPKATPMDVNLSGQSDGSYVLYLQALELNKVKKIVKSQPLDQVTVYQWTKATAPIVYHLTWIDGAIPSIEATELGSLNDQGVVVGRAWTTGTWGSLGWAYRWTAQSGLELLDDLQAVWTDLIDGSHPTGWSAYTATDINELGQIVGAATWNRDGGTARGFMFDPTFGFFLLPNTVGPGRFIAQDINENGDVLGVYYVNVNGNYSDDHIFFWTPLNLGESTLLLPGLTRSDGITVMNDDFFAAYLKEGANVNTGLDWRLYSYTVQSDGAFDCQLDSDLPMVFTLGAISRNSLLPFNQWLEGGVGEEGLYRLGIYDAVTRQATTFAPCSWRGVGNANLSGDILHAGPDNSLRLYRHADVVHERVVGKIRDLLEESARTDFDAVSTISRRSQVNSSNVCCVPVDNPFDHIAVNSMSPSGGYQRAFMLTPIAK